MALPTPLVVRFMEVDQQLRASLDFANSMIAAFDAAVSTAPNERFGIAHAVDQNCKVLIDRYNEWKTFPGLAGEAAVQYQVPAADIVGAVQNLVNQMTSYRTQYAANINNMNEPKWTTFRGLLVNLRTAADITF